MSPLSAAIQLGPSVPSEDAVLAVVAGAAWPRDGRGEAAWQAAVLAAEVAALGVAEPPAEAELWDLAPDPDSGPGGLGEDLPAELLIADAQAAAAAAVPEVLPAGLRCEAAGEGPGFGGGGVREAAGPGRVLGGLAAEAWAGRGGVDDDQLIGVVRAWRRLSSWVAAGELAAAGELLARRERGGAAGAGADGFDCAAAELGCALTLTQRGAERLTDTALALRDLPATAAALAAGRIDMAKALVVLDGVTGLDRGLRPVVEAHVLGQAPGQTTGELRAAVRRAVLAVDPAAAQRRREQAQKDARVEVWDEPAGTKTLAERDLPPAEVLAADRRITALARWLKKHGAPGGMDQLRAQVYLALLADQPVEELLPQRQQAAGDRAAGECAAGECAAGECAAGECAAGECAARDRTAGDSTARDSTAMPDEAAGHRPDDGAAAERARGEAGNSGIGYTGTSGAGARAGARAGAGFGAVAETSQLPAAFSRSSSGPSLLSGAASLPAAGLSGALAGISGTVNLTVPLQTLIGLTDAPALAPGFGPLDAATARDLAAAVADHSASRWCVTVTDQAGRPVGHGCGRRAQRGSGADRAEATESVPADWNLIISVGWLTAAKCAHQWETPAYEPTRRLRHLVEVRNPRCSFPGCRRPAVQCDCDHTIAYERGGRTCACNLGPLCRRHHKINRPKAGGCNNTRPATSN